MAVTAPDEEIVAAQAYESLHVPALFQQWAPIILDSVNALAEDRILDVACGTGVLAREVKARCGDSGSVAGLDAGSGMLAVAKELAPSIAWQQGLAESLPYEDASFDVVVSQFGLMFFRDRLGAIREMLRILAPGGRLAGSVRARRQSAIVSDVCECGGCVSASLNATRNGTLPKYQNDG
jgi:ubiquinone/menaquinone biosynthesis C-methylase UbiE